MKTRSIILPAHEVLGIREGSIHQLRRVAKEIPSDADLVGFYLSLADTGKPWQPMANGKRIGPSFACPFGRIGDRLWGRETWARVICRPVSADEAWWPGRHPWPGVPSDRPSIPYLGGIGDAVIYRADGEMPGKFPEPWRPSVHMPRWASRITLEVVNVRVERAKDITERDAMLCGVQPRYVGEGFTADARTEYGGIFFDRWYGAGAWERNRWMWVVDVNRVEAP